MTTEPTEHDDLRLTDEQVKELSAMGPLGREAARGLLLWREGTDAPWAIGWWCEHSGSPCVGNLASRSVFLGMSPCEDADVRAIIRDRNTAELRAALTFHTLRYLAHVSMPEGASISEKEYQEYTESIAAMKAIDAALEAL